MPKLPEVGVGWYNGFSHEQRAEACNIAIDAFMRDKYRPEPFCEFCQAPGTVLAPSPEAPLLLHHEDCNRPLSPAAICVECFVRMHMRFRRPNRWLRHCYWIRKRPSSHWPSIDAFLMTIRTEYRDIGEFAWRPSTGKWFLRNWWERLSCDPALVSPNATVLLTYGKPNDVRTLVARALPAPKHDVV